MNDESRMAAKRAAVGFRVLCRRTGIVFMAICFPSAPEVRPSEAAQGRIFFKQSGFRGGCKGFLRECRDSMKMSPCELFRNVPFGALEAARSAPANGAPVATPQTPSPAGAAWACGGSTPLATALLASKHDAPTKRGHFLVSYEGDISKEFRHKLFVFVDEHSDTMLDAQFGNPVGMPYYSTMWWTCPPIGTTRAPVSRLPTATPNAGDGGF